MVQQEEKKNSRKQKQKEEEETGIPYEPYKRKSASEIDPDEHTQVPHLVEHV